MATTESTHADFPDERSGLRTAGHGKGWLFQGIALVILGLLAIALPLLGTLVVEIVVGWLFLIGGLVRGISLVRTRDVPGYGWSLLSAVMAVAAGAILIAWPLTGVVTLTLVLMALFTVEGITAIFAAFDFRNHSRSWGWLLFTGVIDLLLVFMLWQGWPATAAWAIGLIAGIDLLFLGVWMITIAIEARSDRATR